MRNFSTVTDIQFVSYRINAGEYENNVPVSKVLKALAVAFESPLSHVEQDFNNILLFGDGSSDFWPRLRSAEYRVLVNLHAFVVQIARKDKWDFTSQAFVYINLNTGAKVVWTHMSV